MMYNTTPFLLFKIWLNSMTCCIDLQSTNLLVASPTTLEFHSSLLLATISAAMQYQMRRPIQPNGCTQFDFFPSTIIVYLIAYHTKASRSIVVLPAQNGIAANEENQNNLHARGSKTFELHRLNRIHLTQLNIYQICKKVNYSQIHLASRV